MQISGKGSQWETILANAKSSGLTNNLQDFDIPNIKVWLAKIIGFRTNENFWKSITEIELYGIPEKKENANDTLTSIENDILDNIISVYPNPNNGRFNLAIKETLNHDGRISVINTSGQRIYERSLKQSENLYTFDLSYLPDGLYLIHVFVNEKMQTTKKVLIE